MSELAIPDPLTETIPVGWSEAVLERLPEVEDVSTLDGSRATLAGYVAAYRAKGADRNELQRAERYVEIRIGELLGPAQEHGTNQWSSGQNSTPRGIDKARASEYRSLAAWRNDVIAQVRAGVLGRAQLLAKIAAWEAAASMNGQAEDETAEAASFSVIYADPPWTYEHNPTPLARAIENHYTTLSTDAICGLSDKARAADDDGSSIKVDEKVREQHRDDVLLETWSDVTRKVPGWAHPDSDLHCDYIAYALAPSSICYLLPYQAIRRTMRTHGDRWYADYKVGETASRHNGRQWKTQFVCIPTRALLDALRDAFVIHWENGPASMPPTLQKPIARRVQHPGQLTLELWP